MSYRLHRGSVLPRVDVKRTAEGTLVHALRPTSGEVGELVLVGIALLIFLGAAFAPKGGVLAQGFRALNAGAVLMTFLAMLAHYLRRRRLFKGTLLVRPWPIRLGGEVTVKYRAMLKKSATVSSLTAKLQCAEEVVIGIEEEWTIPIPPTLPPSFEVPSNAVRWRLTTVLTTSSGDVPADFTLLVIPEVAE